MEQHKETAATPEVAAKNRRLAIILAIIAVVIYAGFILLQVK